MTYEEMNNFDEKSSFLDQKGLKIGYLIFCSFSRFFNFRDYANDSQFMDVCVRIVIMFGLTNNLFLNKLSNS